MSKKSWLLFIFVLFLSLLSRAGISLAGSISYEDRTVYYQTDCGGELGGDTEKIAIGGYKDCCKKPTCTCCGCFTGMEWVEYRASTDGCGPMIQKRKCTVKHTGNCCGTSENCVVDCTVWSPAVKDCRNCGSWRKAKNPLGCSASKWSFTRPGCTGCEPDCIKPPTNLRYYSNSIYPLDPWAPTSTYQMNSNDIYLPVKLDWDDVKGWKDGWGTKVAVPTNRGFCKPVTLSYIFGDWTINPQSLARVVTSYISDRSRTYTPQGGSSYILVLDAGAGAGVYTVASKTVNLNASDTISGWAAFDSKDYMPFNDDARAEIRRGGALVATPWSSDVNTVGNYGDGPWQNWTWTASATGTYTIQLKVRNVRDNLLPSTALFSGLSIGIREEGGEEGITKHMEDYSNHPLRNCKKQCREKCYKQEEENPKPTLYPYRKSFYDCLSQCKKNCDTTHTLSLPSCINECPYPQEYYPKDEFIKSYVIKIWDSTSTTGELLLHHYGVTTTAYTEVLATSSEFVPPDSCFFNSSSTYYWTVKACCNADGTECGPESATSTFITNSAPEPIYPLDADWNGTGTVKNIPTVPATSTKLRWCSDSKMWKYGSSGLDIYLLSATNTPYYHPYRQGIPYKFFQTCDTCVYSKIATTSKVGYDYYYHQFSDDKIPNFFTKITSYFWKAVTCMFYGMGCGKESQGWRFQTASTTLEKVSLISPSDGELVPLPVHLKWSHIQGANSYFYEFWEEGSVTSTTGTVPFGRGEVSLGELELNKKYIWRVKPCWDFEGKKCEAWSDTSSFITTLAPPTLNSPVSTSSTFPISFDWDDVPFAEYYILQISSTSSSSTFESLKVAEKRTSQSQTSVDFSPPPPNFVPEKTYYWRVRACLGSFCGNWSKIKKFGTELPSIPTNPSPSDGENLRSFLPYNLLYKPSLSWSKSTGAKFYQVTIGYGTENATCTDKLGKTIVNKVVSQPSLSLNSDLKCEGTYFWTVRACLDTGCNYASEWANQGFCTTTKNWAGSSFWETLNSKITNPSPKIFELCSATSTHKDDLIDKFFWSFNFTKPTPAQEQIGGLVPCHRSFDNPNTPWNEREPCQIKHLFYLLINVIDFVLWKLGLVILTLLVLATGFILYFAPYLIPEEREPIVRVKSLWKAAGIGYFIIFLAWSIINLILVLIGYHFEFFGKWWQIKF